ncbi:unnamed protein product [Caenorhabditis bovis]|uniref:Protein kinase domain-containing protein n=1 Tax=Caenorhabditis bovis TaxID=2654633 RepID=A0A8S1FA05_9PELO|nr:unnamed protein product [Caenorhabditis bovis]
MEKKNDPSELNRPDAIMEPNIDEVVEACFEQGQTLEQISDQLAKTYIGSAQVCNVLCGMLDELGDKVAGNRRRKKKQNVEEETSVEVYNGREESEKAVEEAFTNLLLKKYKPELADRLLEEGKEDIEWLSDMICHKRWREFFYKLMSKYENSDMLKFVVKLISDAGYRTEMTTVNNATQQFSIFSRVLLVTLESCLVANKKGGVNSEAFTKAMDKFKRIALQGIHTYLYTMFLLTKVGEQNGGWVRAACEYFADELREAIPKSRLYEASVIRLRLVNPVFFKEDNQFSCKILQLATHGDMTVADANQIYEQITQEEPPPISILRDPIVFDFLIDQLFHCDGVKVDEEMKMKFIYLLAYYSAADEDPVTGEHDTEDVEEVRCEIENCLSYLEVEDSLFVLLSHFLASLETEVVACGLVHYIRTMLLAEFRIGDVSDAAFVILDNICTQHHLLRSEVFEIYCDYFDKISNEATLAEVIMERERLIMDRLVHLLSVGEPIMVLERLKTLLEDNSIDSSLVRYFVTEVSFLVQFVSTLHVRIVMQNSIPQIVADDIEFKYDKLLFNKIGFGGYANVYHIFCKEKDAACKIIKCSPLENRSRTRGLSLDSLVQQLKNNQIAISSSVFFDWSRQILNGMLTISKTHIHRDLKTQNILIKERVCCCPLPEYKYAEFVDKKCIICTNCEGVSPSTITLKICDFGECVSKKKVEKSPCGTTQFLAPEALKKYEYSEKSDVYAFGMVLYEIKNDVPFRNMNQHQILFTVTHPNFTLDVDHLNSSKISEIIAKCIKRDPSDRPTFEELNTMVQKNCSHYSYIQLADCYSRIGKDRIQKMSTSTQFTSFGDSDSDEDSRNVSSDLSSIDIYNEIPFHRYCENLGFRSSSDYNENPEEHLFISENRVNFAMEKKKK